jgi:hypothetical protein
LILNHAIFTSLASTSLTLSGWGIGSIRGVTYYTNAEGVYRVVTTLADGEAGLPVRFETILADTQRFTISVPGKLGERTQEVEISRTGDKINLTRSEATSF